MNKIDKLINELCPNGVEYISLNKILDYIQPSKYIVKSTKYDNNFDIPVLTAGQSFILGYTNETGGIYVASKLNPVIIFDDFTTSNHWVDFCFKVKSSALKILVAKDNQKYNFRYIFYCIKNINYTSAEHSRQWIQKFSELKIPVPPIEIQNQIVNILNKFIELEAELEAEQEARKKQYDFYRGEIFPSGETFKIKDICKNVSSGGTPFTRNYYYYDGDIPWLRTQEVNWNTIYDTKIKITELAIEKSSAKIIPANCVIVAMYGATVGRVAINSIPLSTNQACCNLEIDDNIALPKYVFHWLSKQYTYIKSLGQGSQTNINANTVKNLEIPIPSLEEQERIVNILDKFDKLINDINEGLPAEIEMRRKQYEYYRNKLLTFEEISYE
jgi:type I restriction enzyme S subunit